MTAIEPNVYIGTMIISTRSRDLTLQEPTLGYQLETDPTETVWVWNNQEPSSEDAAVAMSEWVNQPVLIQATGLRPGTVHVLYLEDEPVDPELIGFDGDLASNSETGLMTDESGAITLMVMVDPIYKPGADVSGTKNYRLEAPGSLTESALVVQPTQQVAG